MKKRLQIFIASVLCALTLASCVKPEEIENLQNQINEIKQENIASIESQIKTIKSSITKLETTSVELKGFIEKIQQKQSELSEKDAELERLIASLQNMDADLQSQISNLKKYVDDELKSAKDWVSATFATIDMYNSVSSTLSEIQNSISSLDSRLTNMASTLEKALSDAQTDINGKIKELSDRLDACEEKIDSILARIQSIVVLPTYSDGSVKIAKIGTTDICFEVTPRSASVALAKAELSVFSLDAIATETKASVFTNIPVTQVADNGEVLIVTVNGTNLSAGFFAGRQSMSARLKVQDGNNARTSEFFALSPVDNRPDYIENGIKLGQGIPILGDWNNDGTQTILYWAPVNCGYEATGTVNSGSDHRLGKLYQWGAGDSSLPYMYNGSPVVAREMYYDSTKPSPWYDYNTIKGTTSDKWNNNQGPCPEGWRLPTSLEFKVLCAGKNGYYGWVDKGTYAGQSNTYAGAEFFGANSDKTAGKGVFFPAAGCRDSNDGRAYNRGSNGYYWSSTPRPDYSDRAFNLYFSSSNLSPQGNYDHRRAYAFSVRCLSE